MNNATFTLKVLDALSVEASSVAINPTATTPYARAYNLGKTLEELEALIDELEPTLTHHMTAPSEVTETGYRRAVEIHETILREWDLTPSGWIKHA